VAAVPHTYLVFMFDRSTSMADSSKWTSCKTALKSFFSSASSNVSASLQFFPLYNGSDMTCAVSDYQRMAVPMTTLPSSGFARTIDQEQLNYDTPTLPALEGAIGYAKSIRSQHAGANVAVVLVTDGYGDAAYCGSDMSRVDAAAKGAAGEVKTYVIGVGTDLSDLNAVASAGGTSKAYLLHTGSSTQTISDFQAALGNVKTSTVSCDVGIPAPPNGQTLDPTKVNVSVTTGTKASTLTYDSSCANGDGWHYDNPTAPTKIQLCPTTCTSINDDTSGAKIDVLFGCTVKGVIK
jgi:hypothetical protein